MERHSQDSQLEGGQVFPSTQWGRGSAHLVNRRSSTCWGAPKSPVGAQECGEVGGVTAQEGRHQVGHQHLPSASPDAVHPAGLIPVPCGHTFPRSGTQQRHESEAAPKTPGRHVLELRLSPQASRTHDRRRGNIALRRIIVLASRVNWHLAMVTCVSVSGQFVLDSSPCVNYIIPVVVTTTSHSGDENWGERG